jgi:RNA polymerase sigma-70 factor (ECF subfamily)
MGEPDSLRRAFEDAGGRCGDEAGGGALESTLAERVAAGKAAWPTLRLDEVAFVRHLAKHSAEGLPLATHAGDMWLACACALAVPGAAEAFEKGFRPFIERAVARVDRSEVDEATQSVLVSLLVAEPGLPRRIGEYAGRAGLKAWVTTIAANATLRLHRRMGDQPHETLSGLAEQVAMAEPELALARARHAGDLDAALRDAMEGLDGRQRIILRMRHLKGWRLEQLATMYRVSRATAARMVTAAHESLLVETKRLLRERLRLTDSELESLVALLQSQLEVSLVKLLGETQA